MKKEEEKIVIYKTHVVKIQVSIHYSEHKKTSYVQGSIYGQLETGMPSFATTIKLCIKKFIEDNNLKMNGKISHSIYGIYAVDVS